MNSKFKCSNFLLGLYLTFNLSLVVYCGDLTISYSPSSLRFGSADSLYLSELDDLVATSLGYTPESVSWHGLTITSAFKYPFASIVFGIKTEGIPIKLEGASYELKEDVSLTESFNSVSSLIGARAQRPVHFEMINVFDFVGKVANSVAFPQVKFLDENKPNDLTFLREMRVVSMIADFIKNNSSLADKGQDIFFIGVDSFAALVKAYGADSPQVKEAEEILRSSLEQALYRLRSMYKDRVIVFDALLVAEPHLRRVREAPFGDEEKNDTTNPHNLASEYSEDFPVIFNIVLILSIILIVAIVATSAAMGLMDPGRDSIIYRMTNPRMKKDQ